jgi:hypothetical protein
MSPGETKDNLRLFHGEAREVSRKIHGWGRPCSQVFDDMAGRHNLQEGTMDSSKSPTPTPEQKGKTTKTAKDETVELSVEELEERIAPRTKGL